MTVRVPVLRWNDDKKHRCPACHTIVDTGQPATWRAVYECCRCDVQFARWPMLARLLPVRRCDEIAEGRCPHKPGRSDSPRPKDPNR